MLYLHNLRCDYYYIIHSLLLMAVCTLNDVHKWFVHYKSFNVDKSNYFVMIS